LPGEICYQGNCLPVPFLTTRWEVSQVQQVLNLFYAGYSPYKIARTVHRRTVDVYQIVYHRGEVEQIVGFLTTPHGTVVCCGVEEEVLYISTTWNCRTLIDAYVMLSKGYSAYYVARVVHKRTADVVAIRNHMAYFREVINSIYKKKPGILKYNEYAVNFALPGEYTVQQVCQMLRNNDPLLMMWLTSDDPDAQPQLVVIFTRGGVSSVDLFRGCVLTYDLASLIAYVITSIIPVEVGIMGVSTEECKTIEDFCDFEWLINSVVSSYFALIESIKEVKGNVS